MSREASVLSIDHVQPSGHIPQRLASPRQHGERLRLRHGRPRPRVPELDVVVVGGGPAGLSAALVLGRARRRVLVLDTGRPANIASRAIGGLLGHGGVAPADLRRAGREQLAEFPTVEVRDAAMVVATVGRDRLGARLDDGTELRTRALVLAHGLSYEPPALPGIQPLWGRSVFHCPFCDGWEVRDRALAVHGNGPDIVRTALVVSGWSSDVVVLTDGPARLDATGQAALAAAGVRVREEPIRRLAGQDGRLDRIEFVSGPVERRDALFVRTRRGQPNGLAAGLGCELTADGTIVTDTDGRTTVVGVYAAGDAATDQLRSVAAAIGTGSRTALAVALDHMAVAAAA
jgi:thioredoxin reductase